MSTSYPLSIDKLRIVNNSDDESMSEPSEEPRTVRAFKRFNAYASSLPYSIESNSQMQELLDYYLMKVVQVSDMHTYIGICSCPASVSRPRTTSPAFCSGIA
jgi:hypothetical protein